MTEFDNQDYIDLRDVTDRVEELESFIDDVPENEGELTDEQREKLEEYQEELDYLNEVLDSLRGQGGDHDWRENWYPLSLINEDYFQVYAEELASDLYGKEISEARWPFSCIDWEEAAEELSQDYSSIECFGSYYLYR